MVDTLPKTATTLFRDKVQIEIDKRIVNGTLLKAIIQSVDEDKKFSLVDAFVNVAGEAVLKKYFIYDDLNSTLVILPLKESTTV